jgi:hypothetical protein
MLRVVKLFVTCYEVLDVACRLLFLLFLSKCPVCAGCMICLHMFGVFVRQQTACVIFQLVILFTTWLSVCHCTVCVSLMWLHWFFNVVRLPAVLEKVKMVLLPHCICCCDAEVQCKATDQHSMSLPQYTSHKLQKWSKRSDKQSHNKPETSKKMERCENAGRFSSTTTMTRSRCRRARLHWRSRSHLHLLEAIAPSWVL